MAMSSRERFISFACVVCGALLAADRLAWTPYIERRAVLLEQKENKTKAVNEAQQLLNKEKRLRAILAKMGPSVESDASTAEVQILHHIHDWELAAGLTNASFHRVRAVEESGFTHLSFHISAGGGIASVASLIYAMESADIPLRIDELHVLPKKEGEELMVQINVSTLCRKIAEDPHPRVVSTETAAAEDVGVRP